MFNSYRSKLIIAFIFVAIVPILYIGLNMSFKAKSQATTEELNIRSEAINYEIEKIEMWFNDNEKLLKSIKVSYPLIQNIIEENDNTTKVNKYLKSHISSEDSFLNIFMTFEDGSSYNSRDIILEQDTRLRDWYVDAYETDNIVWTQPYEDWLTGNPVITVSMTLHGQDGHIEGVLGADLNFQQVLNKFTSVKIDENSSTYIITPEDEVFRVSGEDIIDLDRTDREYKENINYILRTVRDEKIGNKTFNLKEEDLDKEYLGVYNTVPSIDWQVLSMVNSETYFYNSTDIKESVIYTVAIGIILIIVFSMFFSRIFSRSLQKLKNGAIEIQKGNYDHRIEISRNDEFDQLSNTFNDMASNLKKSYDKLRNTTDELLMNNDQLQEMNVELEASYEQLQATTDQLNESESKYRVLIENMHDMVFVIDSESKVTFVNNQVEKILGYKKEYFLAKDTESLEHVCEGISIWGKIRSTTENDFKNQVFKFKSKDGKVLLFEINSEHIYDNEQFMGIQGVARNVTKRVQMEKEILKRNRELSTINKISTTLNTTMKLKEMLQNCVDDISSMLETPLCSIRLLEENNNLELMGYAGRLSHSIISKNISLDDDIMGKVIRTGEIIEFNVNDKEFITPFNKDILESDIANYAKIFPLKARGNVVGTLTVSTKEQFSESDTNIITSLCNEIAIHIENINLYQGLKKNYMKTIKTLAAAVEAKDKYTQGHSLRVSKYAVMIAEHANLSKELCEEIEVAGILHDIGKIGVSDQILTKPGKLTDLEYRMITEHPMIGNRILRNVGFSEIIMNALKYHHKRYDLKGYPYYEHIEELPIEASIIGVADAFDAMTSSRSYRVAMSFDDAIQELKDNKGTQFHPDIVNIMLEIFDNNKDVLREIALTKTIAS